MDEEDLYTKQSQTLREIVDHFVEKNDWDADQLGAFCLEILEEELRKMGHDEEWIKQWSDGAMKELE